MRQYLTAKIQATTPMELNEIVEPFVMERLKREHPYPEIRVYSVGHEGKANLNLPGIGTKTFTWIQAAVQWISDKLRIGTPVFDRHDPNTNSHEGRVQIGEVVGRMTKTIGDRFNTLAAIHVLPQFKSRPLDVASIEAEIEFDHDDHQAWPTNIANVSGVALSSSDTDQPGFPGATLLQTVQAYVVQAFEGEKGEIKMNQSDVKKAAIELEMKPSDIFGIDDIMSDNTVTTKVKKDNENLYNNSDRFKQERDKARETVTTLEGKVADSEKKILQHEILSKSTTIIEAVLADPARKLDDRAKVFIKRNLGSFASTAENEDALKVDVEKFVDSTVTEYAEVAKVFGVDIQQVPAPAPAGITLPASLTVEGQTIPPTTPLFQQPSAIPPPREEVLAAEMNPDTNPFIPGGKAALAQTQ